jgi:hypothetical protein
LPSNAQENNMIKKGSGTRNKDADIAMLDEIRKTGASLDDLFLHVDWSADKDMFARLDDWSIVDEMLTYDWSALDEMIAMIGPVLDEMFADLNDWSTLPHEKSQAHFCALPAGARTPARGDGSSFHRAPAAIGLRRRAGDRSQPVGQRPPETRSTRRRVLATSPEQPSYITSRSWEYRASE